MEVEFSIPSVWQDRLAVLFVLDHWSKFSFVGVDDHSVAHRRTRTVTI